MSAKTAMHDENWNILTDSLIVEFINDRYCFYACWASQIWCSQATRGAYTSGSKGSSSRVYKIVATSNTNLQALCIWSI